MARRSDAVDLSEELKVKLEGAPEWCLPEILRPKALGEGRNNQMIQLGPSLVRECSFDDEDLFELFTAMFPDLSVEQEDEVKAVIRSAIKLAEISYEVNKSEFAAMRKRLEEIEASFKVQLRNAVPAYTWNESTIRSHQASCGIGPLNTQRRLFLETMFEPDDTVWIGMVHQSGERKRNGIVVGDWGHKFQQVRSWLEMPLIPGEFVSHCTFQEDTISRCNESAILRRYLVVESDTMSTDEVGAVFNYLVTGINNPLTLKAVVHSGGKSLHGWFDWPGDDCIEDARAMLKGLNCDVATTRVSQPVRLPGVVRHNTGKPQELLWLA